LSREIKELELELGVLLFSRTRNKVIALTPQGEEVLRTFQRMLSDIKKVHDVGLSRQSQR
jgi:DNA-binding transcriptional LysR family regulator